MRRLSLIHYGPLRDFRGTDEEHLVLPVATPGELYEVLELPLAQASLAVAVNDELVPWDHPLMDGDTVIFLPPVSGG